MSKNKKVTLVAAGPPVLRAQQRTNRFTACDRRQIAEENKMQTEQRTHLIRKVNVDKRMKRIKCCESSVTN